MRKGAFGTSNKLVSRKLDTSFVLLFQSRNTIGMIIIFVIIIIIIIIKSIIYLFIYLPLTKKCFT